MDLREQLSSEFGDSIEVQEPQPDCAVDGVLPRSVAAPRDEESAQQLVAWCGANDVPFIPRGGGTKLGVGAKPSRFNLLISTEKLHQVFDHDEGNATISAGAGITLDELDRVVLDRGQFVPLDWNSGSGATLGGVVATNHFGATKVRYSAPRDLVVGLSAALSDGRVVQMSSKVVKNVSGYDLNKLFIGSYGTLGLITRVTIRLRPNDAVRREWQSTPASWYEAKTLANQILNGPFEPALLWVVAREDTLSVQARFDGSKAAVDAQLARLPESTSTESELSTSSTEEVLAFRATLPLARAASWAQRAAEFGPTKVLWECGLGVVRLEFQNAPENAGGIVQELRALAEQNEGAMIVTRAPGELKTSEFVWGEPRSDFALQRQLKSTLDAAKVCSPGRFVGGL